MSNIYIKEPPTNGKVLLKTTLGDIDVEIWSKEAPLACRNFVQLCLERYYDGTIFHRVIRDFIAQGGDPTGSGEGGESIYGHPFKDEFHSRLKFSRRGLVAMANGGPNDNGSQFFFSLGRVDDLNKKHTIFGKVTGDTLYNMIRFNDIPTDKEDRPIDPAPKIIKTEVLLNPFDDIVPRVDERRMEKRKGEKPKSQSRATKNFSLLSFGEEAEEDEEETTTVSKSLRIRSSHDVLTEDPRLSSQPAVNAEELEVGEDRKESEEKAEGSEEEEEGYDMRMRERVRGKLKKRTVEERDDDDDGGEGWEWEDEETRRFKRMEKVRQETQQLKRELREAKRQKEKVVEEEQDKFEALPEPIRALRQEQALYKNRKRALGKGGARELQTLELLTKFKSRLLSARSSGELEGEGEEGEGEGEAEGEGEKGTEKGAEEIGGDWLSHHLSFEEERIVVAKDASVQNEDTFDIYDPRNPINKRRRMEDDKRKDEGRGKQRPRGGGRGEGRNSGAV